MDDTSVVVAPTDPPRAARPLRLTSDERLVALVRRGDERAFEAIYDRHHRAILSFCRHMLGVREEAEDAVQHTFLAAFRHLSGGSQQIELRPWLFTIARNRCLSLLRARRQHVDIALVEPSTDGLATAVERREDVRALLGDLAELPEDQRAALLLSELGALDHDGIATVLGCRREKVKALVFQARSSLLASRQARETPCEEIRIELASATGAALRRGPLRRHLRACVACRAFKEEIASQRKLMALALPVLPGAALKASVLSHALGSGFGASAAHGTGAAAGLGAGGAHAGAGVSLGAGVTAGAGASGGTLATLASAGAAKIAISLTIAGAMVGGSVLTVAATHDRHPAAPGSSSSHRPASGGQRAPGPSSLATTTARAHERTAGGSSPAAGAHGRPKATLHGVAAHGQPSTSARARTHVRQAQGPPATHHGSRTPAKHTPRKQAPARRRPSAEHRAKPHHAKPSQPPARTKPPATTTPKTVSDGAAGSARAAPSE